MGNFRAQSKHNTLSMENRDDLRSILPFLPLFLRSSAVFWPPAVVETLRSLSKGPIHSNVNSGPHFATAVSDLRNSLGISALRASTSHGFSLFFDSLMSKDDAENWFGEVVPSLAGLLLRLPVLLETHYQNADVFNGKETGLRLLASQQPGIVFLSQELIAALLACALFCLYPTASRSTEDLQYINFDKLFWCLHKHYNVNQEHKIKCIIHYFERICLNPPVGNVSFERKVLPLKNSQSTVVYPEADFWSKSTMPLCQLEVQNSGLIEDQSSEVLEVDFANRYIGGGALGQGCVQEEIRFMINPELIIAMLFLPSMADNEAIEIVGAERFSDYSGYAASFRFSGDYVDKKSVDRMGRRRTRIVAIDALCDPGKRQYRSDCMLRECNKAFCGFFNQQNADPQYQALHKESGEFEGKPDNSIENVRKTSRHNVFNGEELSASIQGDKKITNHEAADNGIQVHHCPYIEGEIGVATGNWGCGAFGGDPEVKVVIQWLAASQAQRPFILYYTFHLGVLQKLEVVVQWILSQGWTVGELWNILVEYSTQRLKGKTVGFFNWLLPSLYTDDPSNLDVPNSWP